MDLRVVAVQKLKLLVVSARRARPLCLRRLRIGFLPTVVAVYGSESGTNFLVVMLLSIVSTASSADRKKLRSVMHTIIKYPTNEIVRRCNLANPLFEVRGMRQLLEICGFQELDGFLKLEVGSCTQICEQLLAELDRAAEAEAVLNAAAAAAAPSPPTLPRAQPKAEVVDLEDDAQPTPPTVAHKQASEVPVYDLEDDAAMAKRTAHWAQAHESQRKRQAKLKEAKQKEEDKQRTLQEFRSDREHARLRVGAGSKRVDDPRAAAAMDRLADELNTMVINGPKASVHRKDWQDDMPPIALFKNFNGDFGASVAAAIEGLPCGGGAAIADKVEAERGKSAMMAACTGGVARLFGDNPGSYTQAFDSRPKLANGKDARPKLDVEADLKPAFFDAPMAAMHKHFQPSYHGPTLAAVSEMRDIKPGQHGHVLVITYGAQSEFKVHLDQNSKGVALWSLGRTARFAVCLSPLCQRIEAQKRAAEGKPVSKDANGKDTCPHCYDFECVCSRLERGLCRRCLLALPGRSRTRGAFDSLAAGQLRERRRPLLQRRRRRGLLPRPARDHRQDGRRGRGEAAGVVQGQARLAAVARPQGRGHVERV